MEIIRILFINGLVSGSFSERTCLGGLVLVFFGLTLGWFYYCSSLMIVSISAFGWCGTGLFRDCPGVYLVLGLASWGRLKNGLML